MMHFAGPIEGRRNDWTFYRRSDLENELPIVLEINGKSYFIYEDSGYNRRWYMEIPCQGATLSET